MRQLLIVLLSLLTLGSNAQYGFTKLDLSLSESSKEIAVLDSIVFNKSLILTGENHQYNELNAIVKMSMIRYLHTKGFNYFGVEFGYGFGQFCDEYVKTGDSSIMKNLEDIGVDFQFLNLLREIKTFNDSLSADEKVNVVGVDYTRFPYFALQSVEHTLLKNGIDKSKHEYFEDLKSVASMRYTNDDIGFYPNYTTNFEDFDFKQGFKSYQYKLFRYSAKKLVEDFYTDSLFFKTSLGEEYNRTKKTMDDLLETIRWSEGEGVTVQSHLERERHLAKRTLEVFENDSSAKFFGQFGKCHIRTKVYEAGCYAFDVKSFFQRIAEKDSTWRKNMLNIPLLYNQNGDYSLDQDYKALKSLKGVIQDSSFYLYENERGVLQYDDGVEKEAKYAIVISKRNSSYFDGNRSTYEPRKNPYRDYEEYMGFGLDFEYNNYLPNNVNQDFGQNIFQNPQQAIVARLQTFMNYGDFIMGASVSIPQKINQDSLQLNFTNYRVFMGGGVSSIYRKRFTLYHNINLFAGSAKIVEEVTLADPNSSIQTWSDEKISTKYRNPYIGFELNTGMKLKFEPISIDIEGGYRLDVSNLKWRNSGIINSSAPTSFSGWYIKAGFTIFSSYKVSPGYYSTYE